MFLERFGTPLAILGAGCLVAGAVVWVGYQSRYEVKQTGGYTNIVDTSDGSMVTCTPYECWIPGTQ